MPTDKRLVSFVAKLNRMTQEGSLSWRVMKETTSRTGAKIPMIFGAVLKDQYIAMYPYHYEAYDYMRNKSGMAEGIVLAFCDSDWMPILEFHDTAGNRDLWEAVKRHVTNADSFIDQVLSENSED